MPRICYVEHRFSRSRMELVDQANAIIGEYVVEGFRLTLRQLYYQFVARDLLPNAQRSYKRLGQIVAEARNAGLIDWDTIEDRTRELRENGHWDSPADILRACAGQFRYDLWAGQRYRPEVWIEKDALVGVFEPTCIDQDVPLFSCRGYTSQSEAWEAGRRLQRYLDAGQRPIVFHFGDHDPSGIDMTRDLCDRLALYAEAEVQIQRLALNRDQIDQYRPPPNPAKVTDSRYVGYVKLHGQDSWELDALDPRVLRELVETAVEGCRDGRVWNRALARQDAARARLARLAEDWLEDGGDD